MVRGDDMELKHYTSLESLYKILESKKMRFTTLKNVDDKEEQWTSDLSNHGQHIFVCCFNVEKKENLCLWNMHKMNGEGVIIEFKTKPFEKIRYLGKKDGKNYVVYLDDEISKIEYTDDEDKLYPEVYRDSPNMGYGIHLPLIGKYKSEGWDFEKEYRYRMTVYNYAGEANNEKCEINTIPFEHYDVRINQSALISMNIIVGDNVSEGNKSQLLDYINDYNKKNKTRIIVKDSFYKNKVNSK